MPDTDSKLTLSSFKKSRSGRKKVRVGSIELFLSWQNYEVPQQRYQQNRDEDTEHKKIDGLISNPSLAVRKAFHCNLNHVFIGNLNHFCFVYFWCHLFEVSSLILKVFVKVESLSHGYLRISRQSTDSYRQYLSTFE